MNEHFDIWRLLAGLGVFLFGMILLEESVKALSGRAFRTMIRHYTGSRLKAIGSGSLITAILQSSSAVSLMVLAFVGAGVMSMENGIGVMMGSNIGTTFTSWIVATFGFEMKIESFALPLVGIGGIGLVLFNSSPKLFHFSRLLIGFGFLFLGLNYMKESVEIFAKSFDLSSITDHGLWLYLLVGTLLTAIIQSSSASIAIVLTALNSQLITFSMGAAMVIGANVGTTITVLLGALGGTQAKKRVGMSHLIFNMLTGIIAFLGLQFLVSFIKIFIDIEAHSVMGLAFFHTLFNIIGVILFFPFVGVLARLLSKIYPDHKTVLSVYIHNTPAEVIDAAAAALKNEISHLLQECQLYGTRILHIQESLFFEQATPFERDPKKKLTTEALYENLKILHGEIFSFYSRLQAQILEEGEAKELERFIYASRNIMNSLKNLKGIRKNLEEFDASENPYLNNQYGLFRKRLADLYHDMDRILEMDNKEEQYVKLLEAFVHIEALDQRFIQATVSATAKDHIQGLEISSLLLVNRLFAQASRLQIFGLKDLLLTQEQINHFDRALDMKEILDDEKATAATTRHEPLLVIPAGFPPERTEE